MKSLGEIAPEFLFLIERGFIQTEGLYDEKMFGNALIELHGKEFGIKIVKDRGQILVDVGRNPIGWFYLAEVLQYVDQSITSELLGGPPPHVDILARQLLTHWESVCTILNDNDMLFGLRQSIASQQSEFIKRFTSPV